MSGGDSNKQCSRDDDDDFDFDAIYGRNTSRWDPDCDKSVDQKYSGSHGPPAANLFVSRVWR